MSEAHRAGEPAAPADEGRNGLASPAALALCTAALLVAVPYLVPGLDRLRLLEPLAPGEGLVLAAPPVEEAKVGETVLPDETTDDTPQLAVPEVVPLPEEAKELVGEPTEQDRPPVSIVDPTGRALDAYFAALARVQRGEPGAIARSVAWGDSNVASDLVTSVLRRKLQGRFGDAGHGYVLLARPSRRYFHNDVRQILSSGWSVSRIPGPLAADGLYGIGGTSFRAIGKGAIAKLGTASEGTFGRNVSRVTVNYLKQPGGDGIEIDIDGQLRQTVPTAADEIGSAIATVPVTDAPHEITLRSSGGKVRLFGIWLERDGPGVVVDALGVTSCKVRYLLRIDDDHFAEQLRLRDPQMYMLNFGVNEAREGEALFGGLDAYETTFRDVLARLRGHLPGKSCLVVGPNDIAYNMGKMKPSFPLIGKLDAIQKRVAGEEGCAYWSMREAMGGDGSMGKWNKSGLGEGDMLHPTTAGAQVLGNWLYLALMEAYDAYRARKEP